MARVTLGPLRRASLAGLILGLGCAALEPTESLVVSATFPHPEAADEARAVETRVFALSADDPSPCPGLSSGVIDPRDNDLELEADRTRALVVTEGARPSTVGFVYDLRLGSKAIYGEARDEAGALTLRGCTTSAVTPGASVELELRAPR